MNNDYEPHRCIVCQHSRVFPNLPSVNVHVQASHGRLLHAIGVGYIRDLSRCVTDVEYRQGERVMEFLRAFAGVRGPDDLIAECEIADARTEW